MDEIIPGLWIGDLRSAQDVDNLKTHNIFSILTAMRGRITIDETFIRHQIKLDDKEDEDVLAHLLPSIHFIQAELDKGRGVLVHCQAGVSRSATIVAAYIMYSRKVDPQVALDLIKQVRPSIEPNQGFLSQLELFYSAKYKTSIREKPIRMFYMNRTVEDVMNGDGSPPETEMFAKYPPTPSDSVPNTPRPRRKIRCKMCRQELATREHMLDHGQLGPATPATGTPSVSRRTSNTSQGAVASSSQLARPEGGSSLNPSRRPSRSAASGLSESLSMTSIKEDATIHEELEAATYHCSPISQSPPSLQKTHPLAALRKLSKSMTDPPATSAIESEDEGDSESGEASVVARVSQLLGRRLSDALITTAGDSDRTPQGLNKDTSANASDYMSAKPVEYPDTTFEHPSTPLVSPSDLSAQLFANPKLAALRSPGIPLTNGIPLMSPKPVSAPILANPKCSGYFVEPMKWMDHFLSSGQLAGKITCPNKKCGAKLGNYDWAGVCCGCKEWVTPGFCINRSKVDEVV
ncbi:hypothetical protein CPB84DRAFT_1687860 [Gymnopilus junonius]|uniref:protein-tyrosine-phosphatase n=1 Tax=Gymnopilus junonius TaxID=109634 RepID=A0A9P5TGW9_GYMJU|nr:hypothetical protein CPB84DRAFT_1687860 [Gymnopilus junonius]